MAHFLAKPPVGVKQAASLDARGAGRSSLAMAEKTLNLRGLKCPLPALRARKTLSGMASGDVLVVECTDPLSAIDIPNLTRQTGDHLEDSSKDDKLLVFRIRKK
jgi:tRNA 2-thiouridine synthesizing protein A